MADTAADPGEPATRWWTLKTHGGMSDYTLPGSSLVDAIESNFDTIRRVLHVGNAAGYVLDFVHIEQYGPGRALLVIKAHGQDLAHRKVSTQPQTWRAVIGGLKPGDLPETHVFELRKDAEDQKEVQE